MIEQEAAKEQAEQHDKNTDKIGDTLVLDNDTDAQAYCSSCKVEENDKQHKLPEFSSSRQKTSHGIHNDSHNDRRNESKRDDVEDNLGCVVSQGRVVSFGALSDEQETFRSEHSQRGEGTESEQGKQEEEETKTVLETLEVISQAIEEESEEDSEQDGNGVVGQHQQRVAVEVAPCALGQNNELAEDASLAVALDSRLSRASVSRTISLTIRMSCFRDGIVDIILESSSDIRLGKSLDKIVEICTCDFFGVGRETVRIVVRLVHSSHFEPLLSVVEAVFQRRSVGADGAGSCRRVS